MDFSSGPVVKNPPVNAGDMGLNLLWEDYTCHGATKPGLPNYWACAVEPVNHNYWSPGP